MNFLSQMIGPLPLWGWLGVGAAGLGMAYFFRKQAGGNAGGALGQNGASSSAQDTSQIDPYTGVPYSIEGAINPATGLPAYYGSGQTVDTTGNGQPAATTPAAPRIQGTPVLAPGPSGGLRAPATSTPVQVKPAQAAPVQQMSMAPGANTMRALPGAYDAAHYPPDQATPYWPVMTDVRAGGTSEPPPRRGAF